MKDEPRVYDALAELLIRPSARQEYRDDPVEYLRSRGVAGQDSLQIANQVSASQLELSAEISARKRLRRAKANFPLTSELLERIVDSDRQLRHLIPFGLSDVLAVRAELARSSKTLGDSCGHCITSFYDYENDRLAALSMSRIAADLRQSSLEPLRRGQLVVSANVLCSAYDSSISMLLKDASEGNWKCRPGKSYLVLVRVARSRLNCLEVSDEIYTALASADPDLLTSSQLQKLIELGIVEDKG